MVLPPLFVCRICQHLVLVWFAWSILLLPSSSTGFQWNTKDQSVKASHVLFWFLEQYWCLIKAECCFPTLRSSRDPSPLRLSQHQLGSIRSPDNRRWHMPAFITKWAVAGSLICVCAERFVCGDQEGEELSGIVFLWHSVDKAYAQSLRTKLTHSRLSERGEEFLLTLHFSLSAINTMLLYRLGGPCPCQLFNTYICILNNLIIVICT